MLLKAELYTKPEGDPDVLWTNTDGRGRYCLTNQDEVWWTDHKDNKYLKTIDGFPNAKKPKNYVMRIDGKLAIWDSNMKRIAGPFSDWSKLTEYLDENKDVLKGMEDFDYAPAGYSKHAWDWRNSRNESKSKHLLNLLGN